VFFIARVKRCLLHFRVLMKVNAGFMRTMKLAHKLSKFDREVQNQN
jgi:hypothetical protein